MRVRSNGRGASVIKAPLSRAERVMAALTAAGAVPNPLPTYNLAEGSAIRGMFLTEVAGRGFGQVTDTGWPCDATMDDVVVALANGGAALVYRDDNEALFSMPDGTVAKILCYGSWIDMELAAAKRETCLSTVESFQAMFPPVYVEIAQRDEGVWVPITFWSWGGMGPSARHRVVESADWEEIGENYTAEVRDELDRLMQPEFTPDSGQLLLWHGEPGTGKTWALRALAHEWRHWAEFSYITDPDTFFGDLAIYMIDVLLSNSYQAIDQEHGLVEMEGEKWRVLVLEDTGELLSADAKERSGQGLSRLLNVVDGLIGQGLRVLVIVTTNEPLDTLHPAVTRQGRCLSNIEFQPLTAEEATEWLGRECDAPMTLADLYAADAQIDLDERSVTASGDGIYGLLAEVAEQVKPDGGYGETLWRERDGTVCWIPADWTSSEEADAAKAAFLDVPRVRQVEIADAESYPPLDPEWVAVWPDGLAAQIEKHREQEAMSLAEEPLEPMDVPPDWLATPSARLSEDLAASIIQMAEMREQPLTEEALTAAIEAIGASHRLTTETIAAVLAHAAPAAAEGRGDAITLAALGVLSQAVTKPQAAPAAAPNVEVHIEPAQVTVEQAPVTVTLPEQPITVNVPEQPVHVEVGAQPINVDVHVPEQTVQPAPEVHVHVPEQQLAAPQSVRVEQDPYTGNRRFVFETADDDLSPNGDDLVAPHNT